MRKNSEYPTLNIQYPTPKYGFRFGRFSLHDWILSVGYWIFAVFFSPLGIRLAKGQTKGRPAWGRPFLLLIFHF
jgi:hypothetical protein